jgi:hypothetical protein
MSSSSDTNLQLSPVRPVPVLELWDQPPLLDALPVTADSHPLLQPAPSDPHEILRALFAIASFFEWIFGFACLLVFLAVLAALPILQFLSLGYLLEAGGRIARTGRLRDGFIGVRLAARLGGVVAGCWIFLIPVRIISDMAGSAEIIDPGGRVAAVWRVVLFMIIGLTFVHIVSACARGGRLWHFLWPFNAVWLIRRLFRGGYYAEARDAVWHAISSLRLPYYFWLGLRGFIGAFAWLGLPITLLAVGRAHFAAAPLAGFVGALLLAFVLMYLPFLQMQLAAKNRLSAAFDLGGVRADFRRAPWAFLIAFVTTLLFALPLYLLKIESVPREAAWLPSLVFIVFIFPARLLTGWALARAARRTTPRHWFFRWTARLPLLPAAAFYVLIVFFTQYTSWNGVWSLYEQHAFLVPVPFFGL